MSGLVHNLQSTRGGLESGRVGNTAFKVSVGGVTDRGILSDLAWPNTFKEDWLTWREADVYSRFEDRA